MAENALAAVVVGATGAVGSALVRELLSSPRFGSVTILTRRRVDQFDALEGKSKLAQRVIDMSRLDDETADAAKGANVAFCTMGIGQPRKVSREEFWKVDVEHASAFARGCRRAGVEHIVLLGSVGADASSSSYYLRTKAAAEKGVLDAGMPRASLFRPSLLVTREIRYGLQDRVTQFGFPLVSWALPSRFHQIRVEDLGRAMRIEAERPAAGSPVRVLHYADFVALLDADPRGPATPV